MPRGSGEGGAHDVGDAVGDLHTPGTPAPNKAASLEAS